MHANLSTLIGIPEAVPDTEIPAIDALHRS